MVGEGARAARLTGEPQRMTRTAADSEGSNVQEKVTELAVPGAQGTAG